MQPQMAMPMPDPIGPERVWRALAWGLWSATAVVFVASIVFGPQLAT